MLAKELIRTKQKFEVENNLRKPNGIIGKGPILSVLNAVLTASRNN